MRVSIYKATAIALKSLLEAAGQTIRAGQEIHSVNISADTGKSHGVFDVLHDFKDGASLSNHFKKQCQQYYGSAIDVFLTRLVKEDKAAIREKWRLISELFLKHIKGEEAHGQVRRVSFRMGYYGLES